jgi:hypothetical protein
MSERSETILVWLGCLAFCLASWALVGLLVEAVI